MAPRKRRSRIKFPVLKRLEVRNYALFPGSTDGDGFNHELANGVSVVLGINGIGKTTLLHLIFRLITGPFDPSKFDPSRPGTGIHKLINLGTYHYFSERVPNSAEEAWAEVGLLFGENLLTVRRRLRDLKILSLEENDTTHSLDEETYQELCCKLSGTETPFDFHFLVRHLVFFLEDRGPLIWSDEGQFEILRILFFENDASHEVAQLTDTVRQIDSQYRNRLFHVNREKGKYESLLKELEQKDDTIHDLASLQAVVDGSEKHVTFLTSRQHELAADIEKIEKEVFRLQMDIEEKRQAIRHDEMAFFSQLFPSLNDTAKLVVNALLTDDGCLVCGSDGRKAVARIRTALKNKHCPVCDSPPEAQEQRTAAPLSSARLKRASAQYEKLRLKLEQRQRALDELQEEYNSVVVDLRNSSRELIKNQKQIQRLRDRIPGDQDSLIEKESQLEQDERELNQLKRRHSAELNRLRSRILAQQAQIDNVAETVVSSFNDYATHLLAEHCHLEYDMIDQPIGQSGSHVRLPSFRVLLSSGASTEETERNSSEQVSESQKEFIDLAFRMALMKAATEGSYGRMLVIETPEASLDSVFINQAGELLRKFATTPRGGEGNAVLVSCNLNGAEMVQSLLGTKRSGGKMPSRNAIDRRIIDLIDLAAPSAAYKRHKGQYDQLRELVYGPS